MTEVRRYLEASDWLLRLEAENVSEEDVIAWLRWCERDGANLQAYEKVQQDWRDIVALRGESPRTRARPPARMWVRAAAAVVVACAVGVIAWQVYGPSFRTHEIATQTANKSSTLPDGSSLMLRAQSSVVLEFTPKQRYLRVQENSEAYFDVRRDPARPFIVRAGAIEILAVGTAFDVRHDADRVQVTVAEGKVRISAPGHADSHAVAGERFEFAGTRIALEKIDEPRVLSWREGQLAYDGVALREVLRDINRYSTQRIDVGDARAADIPYTGTVFVSSIPDWLRALELSYPVRAVTGPDDAIILESTP
jgi:transmembrane sensor